MDPNPIADLSLGHEIWQRYGRAPGVIPLLSLQRMSHRIGRLPLLEDIQRRWAPQVQTQFGSAYAWPFALPPTSAGGAMESTASFGIPHIAAPGVQRHAIVEGRLPQSRESAGSAPANPNPAESAQVSREVASEVVPTLPTTAVEVHQPGQPVRATTRGVVLRMPTDLPRESSVPTREQPSEESNRQPTTAADVPTPRAARPSVSLLKISPEQHIPLRSTANPSQVQVAPGNPPADSPPSRILPATSKTPASESDRQPIVVQPLPVSPRRVLPTAPVQVARSVEAESTLPSQAVLPQPNGGSVPLSTVRPVPAAATHATTVQRLRGDSSVPEVRPPAASETVKPLAEASPLRSLTLMPLILARSPDPTAAAATPPTTAANLPMSAANTPATGTPLSPPASTGRRSDMTSEELAEKAMRQVLRRLAVESERRGWQRWP